MQQVQLGLRGRHEREADGGAEEAGATRRARPAMPSIGSRVIGMSDAPCLHMDRRTEEQVEKLQRQLCAAVEHVDELRNAATMLAADLRNRLHALMLQRQAVQRLEGNRRERSD